MILQLNKSVTIKAKNKVLGPKNVDITIDKVKLINIVDNCINKVTASVKVNDFTTEQVVLWEGEDYTNIGNWTQEQANKKIVDFFV